MKKKLRKKKQIRKVETDNMLALQTRKCFPVEVFNLMGQVWTKSRSRMKVELVKAELFTVINFDMSCTEYINYAKFEPNLLKAIKNMEEYDFK